MRSKSGNSRPQTGGKSFRSKAQAPVKEEKKVLTHTKAGLGLLPTPLALASASLLLLASLANAQGPTPKTPATKSQATAKVAEQRPVAKAPELTAADLE